MADWTTMEDLVDCRKCGMVHTADECGLDAIEQRDHLRKVLTEMEAKLRKMRLAWEEESHG
jgi:hypothetical protein